MHIVQIYKQYYERLSQDMIQQSKIMMMEQKAEKDHSQFISLLAGRVATFTNSMVQYIMHLMAYGPEKKKQKKKNQEQDEQTNSERSSQNLQQQREEKKKKKKYFKVRSRLPIDTDGERPKAPTSSFLIYYHDNKHDLAKKFGQTNVSKLTKLASLEWRSLPQQERMKYQKISDESKYRYQKQMGIYKIKNKDKIEQALKKRRAQYRNNWINKKKAQQAKQKGEQIGFIDSSLQFSEPSPTS